MMKFGLMTKGIEGMYRRMSHRCAECGQYIVADEMFGMIIVFGLKNELGRDIYDYVLDQYRNNFENRFIHKECWEKIEIDNYFEKVEHIYNKPWKKPNQKRWL